MTGAMLIVTTKFDRTCAALADRHYSRRARASRQFMAPGETLVLRDRDGLVVFGWHRSPYRWDGQQGVNCQIFRNESSRLSSEIILEAERAAVARFGPTRAFTYVDPTRIRSSNPGCCFKKAGWTFAGYGKRDRRGARKLIFEKFIGRKP